MARSPLQFAVVREDPTIDLRVLAKTPARRALLVASGGCTAFAILNAVPDIELTLVEPNPAQCDLVREKLRLLRAGDPARNPSRWNIGCADRQGLCQRGHFEGLFRQLRAFLCEFVAPEEAWRQFFSSTSSIGTTHGAAPSAKSPDPEVWFDSRWWPVAFDLFFSDAMLETMFTSAAAQHADPGSYPRYFQRVFEEGLRRSDARTNYFLHHVLLGMYVDRPGAMTGYMTRPLPDRGVRFITKKLEEVDDFSSYDFVGLSNVMDWMADTAIERLATTVGATLAAGAAVVRRQLNNEQRHEVRFGRELTVDAAMSEELRLADRSLFYNRIVAGFKRSDGG